MEPLLLTRRGLLVSFALSATFGKPGMAETGRTLDEIAAKSRKVWNSNRSVKENVAANRKPVKKKVVSKPVKRTAKKKAAKKPSTKRKRA